MIKNPRWNPGTVSAVLLKSKMLASGWSAKEALVHLGSHQPANTRPHVSVKPQRICAKRCRLELKRERGRFGEIERVYFLVVGEDAGACL